MVRNIREVINKKSRKLQNTPPFFELSGQGEKNNVNPVPVLSGTQRRLFYSLQPFDYFLSKFFNILLVIATMYNLSYPLRTKNNSLLVIAFLVKLRIREFLLFPRFTSGPRADDPQGCSRSDLQEPTEKVNHRIYPQKNMGYQSILRKGVYHLNPKGVIYE